MSETIIGVVESGKFKRLWPKPASVAEVCRLTSIRPMESVSEESGELDLTEYEDKIIAVRGDDQGGWVYAAEVIDSGGAIAKTLASEVFAKPAGTGLPFEGLEVPGHGPVSDEVSWEYGAPELALVEEGRVFLWSQPGVPADLTGDPPRVGRPQEPLKIPDGARCGAVTRIGPGGQAGFTVVRDPVQALVIEALFELRRNR